MQDIHAAIKAKREAIQRLHDELAVLEHALALLEGDPVTEAPPAADEPRGRLSGPRAKGQFLFTSQVGMTIAVLRDAGAPLHVDEILKRIHQRGKVVKKLSLVGSIARLVKERRVFYRKKPNVYGLLEWNGPKSTPRSAQEPQNGGSGSARSAREIEGSDSKSETGWPGRH